MAKKSWNFSFHTKIIFLILILQFGRNKDVEKIYIYTIFLFRVSHQLEKREKRGLSQASAVSGGEIHNVLQLGQLRSGDCRCCSRGFCAVAL